MLRGLLVDRLLTLYRSVVMPRAFFTLPRLFCFKRPAPTAIMTIPKTFVKVNRKTFVASVMPLVVTFRAIGLDLTRGAPVGDIYAEV